MKRIKLASATVGILQHAPVTQSRPDDVVEHIQQSRKQPWEQHSGNMFESISDGYDRTYDRGNPSETCFDTLYESDANGDGVLQNYEYTTFIADLSDGDYGETEYVDLPFALKVNFAYLSCLCRQSPVNGGENCCIGPESGIWLPPDQMAQLVDNGSGTLVSSDDSGLDLKDLVYLNEICSYTQGAIDYVREEDGLTRSPTGRPTDRPTDRPTLSPVSTESPSGSPTKSPTQSPSTSPPTATPSDEPTRSPIASPTLSPVTEEPTSAEPTSSSPTDSPSGGPSAAPVTDAPVSASPTESPVESPTASPTKSPTQSPSTSPPTATPSDEPTRSPITSPTLSPVTEAPSSAEPTSSSPTGSPLGRPSSAPVTDAPVSESPSASPAESPTAEPASSSPTDSPSGGPSTAPVTDAPVSKSPTESPAKSPTASPIGRTVEPTRSPTQGDPTKRPVVTDEPTMQPVIGDVPTKQPAKVIASPSQTPSQSPMAEGDPTKQPLITSEPTKQPVSADFPTKQPAIGGASPSRSPLAEGDLTSQPVIAVEPTESPSVGPNSDGVVIPPVPTPPTEPTPSSSGSTPSPNQVKNPGSVVAPPGPDDAKTDSISAGGMAAIVIASVLGVYGGAYIWARKRRRLSTDDPSLRDVEDKELRDLEAGPDTLPPGDGPAPAIPPPLPLKEAADRKGEPAIDSSGHPPSEGTDSKGAAVSSLSGSSRNDSPTSTSPDYPGESLEEIERHAPYIAGVPNSPRSPAASEGKSSADDSSSAGASGWSSSAGLSSLHTASFDAGTEDGLLFPSFGATSESNTAAAVAAGGAAAVGVAALANHTSNTSQNRDAQPVFVQAGSSSENSSLESADIARNPVTMYSGSPPSRTSPTSSSAASADQKVVTRDDLNAAIEAGDWAVVGATAALLADSKYASDHSMSSSFEGAGGSAAQSFADSSDSSSINRAAELDKMVEAGDWEGVVLTAAQFEGSRSSLDDSMSTRTDRTDDSQLKLRKAELREEVEQLVRKVVPDEIGNVDEMMLQFQGREDELVETLRTMQERSIAQRARAAVQKSAKLEAKAKAQASQGTSGSGVASRESSGTFSSQGDDPSHYGESTNSHSSSVSDLGMSEDYSSRKTNQSSLAMAIERGDWRAVGEAAALMGDGSITNEGSITSSSSFISAADTATTKDDRAAHLDSLIAKGDWAGVVQAAGLFQAKDDSTSHRTPEENEALREAEMWQAIADQSKQESQEVSGAAEAAEWAISRSLEQTSKSPGEFDEGSV